MVQYTGIFYFLWEYCTCFDCKCHIHYARNWPITNMSFVTYPKWLTVNLLQGQSPQNKTGPLEVALAMAHRLTFRLPRLLPPAQHCTLYEISNTFTAFHNQFSNRHSSHPRLHQSEKCFKRLKTVCSWQMAQCIAIIIVYAWHVVARLYSVATDRARQDAHVIIRTGW